MRSAMLSTFLTNIINTNIYFYGSYELCIRLYFIDFNKLLPKKRQFTIEKFL